MSSDRNAARIAHRMATIAVLAVLVALFGAARDARAQFSLPPGFVADPVVSGTPFTVPTSLALLPDGRLLVAEKSGRVWVVKSGVRHAVPLWNGESEVLDNVDRGLLSIAVDPAFASNRRLYFLYTADPDSDGVDTNDDAFGRLARYELSATDSNAVDPATRAILMGVDWRHGPPVGSQSHTVAALRFGVDGSLLVSIGDGAQFSMMDPGGNDPGLFGPTRTNPLEDIGAFRSQYLGSLAGKLLRVDPATGQGYPSNPFWDGDPSSVRSRVWAYGLRNPFRFAVKPGTGSANPGDANPGTLYIGDVGWLSWEETDIANSPGQNFGWPCFEGLSPQPNYQSATPARAGCDSIGTPSNPSLPSLPIVAYDRSDPDVGTPPGFTGSTTIGGAFTINPAWPAETRGRFAFGDFSETWIRMLETDSLDQLVAVTPFAENTDGPVEIVSDPRTGDLFVASIYTGDIHRIRWTGAGGTTPPVAIAWASPDSGSVPLLVHFSSAASSDADADSLAFLWLFGDGSTSTAADPQHSYVLAGDYSAVLIVDDGRGGIGRDTLAIRVTADFVFPTTALLDRFDRANGPIGPLWQGATEGLVVDANAATPSEPTAWAAINLGSIGPLQEAYYTLELVTPGAQSHALVLKAQAAAPESAHIQIRHDGIGQRVLVSTLQPGVGWQTHGAPIPMALNDGDQFGARAYANGVVEVFLNNALIASRSVANWPWSAAGGRIGMSFGGAYVSRIQDFGGGNANPTGNRPPLALIEAPGDTSWYAPGDTIRLNGAGIDPDDPPDSLLYHWSVVQRRNQFAPSVLQADAADTSLIATAVGEGSNTLYYEARLFVTDSDGLPSSEVVRVFPESDLAPGAIVALPAEPVSGASATLSFRIHNRGRMLPRPSRWRLTLGPLTIAEGDTLVPGLDSVLVSRALILSAAPGTYELRACVDTLGVVVEPDETNNSSTRWLTLLNSSVGVLPQSPRLALSSAAPNPTRGRVALTLELPDGSPVTFDVIDVQGRVVWQEPTHNLPAGTSVLRWEGADARDGRVRPGLYLARVRVADRTFTRRIAIVQ